jgi:hypothetical protein
MSNLYSCNFFRATAAIDARFGEIEITSKAKRTLAEL